MKTKQERELDNFAVEYSTKQEAIIILSILYSYGYRPQDGETLEEWSSDSHIFNYVLVDNGFIDAAYRDGEFEYDEDNSYDFDGLSRLVDRVSNHTPSFECQISDNYRATVSDKGIEVGCQIITFDRFDELSKLVEKFKNIK